MATSLSRPRRARRAADRLGRDQPAGNLLRTRCVGHAPEVRAPDAPEPVVIALARPLPRVDEVLAVGIGDHDEQLVGIAHTPDTREDSHSARERAGIASVDVLERSVSFVDIYTARLRPGEPAGRASTSVIQAGAPTSRSERSERGGRGENRQGGRRPFRCTRLYCRTVLCSHTCRAVRAAVARPQIVGLPTPKGVR